jgi:hypothetical protein
MEGRVVFFDENLPPKTLIDVSTYNWSLSEQLASTADANADDAPSSIRAMESPPAPPSNTLFEELQLLRQVSSLRSTDPPEAVRLLDRYDVQFPNGRLRADYDVLRIRLGAPNLSSKDVQ